MMAIFNRNQTVASTPGFMLEIQVSRFYVKETLQDTVCPRPTQFIPKVSTINDMGEVESNSKRTLQHIFGEVRRMAKSCQFLTMDESMINDRAVWASNMTPYDTSSSRSWT